MHAVATGHKAFYLVLLLVPFLGLWLLEPLLLLGAVPGSGDQLALEPARPDIDPLPLDCGIVPFIVAASIFGAARFSRHGAGLSLWVLGRHRLRGLLSPIYCSVATCARSARRSCPRRRMPSA